MVVKYCVYGLCGSFHRSKDESNLEPGVYFIPFPKPNTTKPLMFQKCKRWVQAVGREDFTIDSVRKGSYICSKHFHGGSGPSLRFPDPIPLEHLSEAEIKDSDKNDRLGKRRKLKTPSNPVMDLDSFTISSSNEISDVCFKSSRIYDDKVTLKSIGNLCSIFSEKHLKWSILCTEESLILSKLNKNGDQIICLKVTDDFHYTIQVLNEDLPLDHLFFLAYPSNLLLNSQSLIAEVVEVLDSMVICLGINDSVSKSLFHEIGDKEDIFCYKTDSIRGRNCNLLLSMQGPMRCPPCKKSLLKWKNRRYQRMISKTRKNSKFKKYSIGSSTKEDLMERLKSVKESRENLAKKLSQLEEIYKSISKEKVKKCVKKSNAN